MSDPIVTNAETFCNALYESAQGHLSTPGWVKAGELRVAVENLTFSKGDLQSKALSTLRDEAAKAHSMILEDQSKTLKLITQVYEEASKTASKTEKLEELGKILVSSGISPSTRSTAKIGLKRFQKLEIGKSYQKGIKHTLKDLWKSGLTKVIEYATFLSNVKTYPYRDEMLNQSTTLHKDMASWLSGPTVKDVLMKRVEETMGLCQKNLMEYLGVSRGHEEKLVSRLEQRLIKLKICTQKQIQKEGIDSLISKKDLMKNLQTIDPVLYALLSIGQELTFLFADPRLFSDDQIENAIDVIRKAWKNPSGGKEMLDNITRQMALGSNFIGPVGHPLYTIPPLSTPKPTSAPEPYLKLEDWRMSITALKALLEKNDMEKPGMINYEIMPSFLLARLLDDRSGIEQAITEYFKKHPGNP